ncbi:MAG: GntR family transcriptional regulator [Firmicutes bacterium]|nr:GntR family transcriptional regulator [Bacillota bacterium]
MIRMPLPHQVAGTMRQRIQSGEWEPGDQIPAEDDLARQFAVSRATIREAISQLTVEGYLVKRRGIGTFVRGPRAISGGLESLISITQLIEQQGYQPGTSYLSVTRRPASEREEERFRAWRTREVAELRRVRTADGTPVLYCVDIFPAQFLPDDSAKLSHSLFRYLEQECGQVVIFAQTEIEVTKADETMAAHLKIPAGSPLLCLNQAHYNQNSTLLLWSHDHFVPGTFRFDVIRHRH